MSSQSLFYQIDARDAAGTAVPFYAAWRNQEFVLFQMSGECAVVLYLLPAPTPEEIRATITSRIIEVTRMRPLDEGQRPPLSSAKLQGSTAWTEMQRAVVGVILGVSEVA